MGQELQWWHIVVPLLTGGLAGAVINNLSSAWRDRIQPVGKRIDITPLFHQALPGSNLRPRITISSAAGDHHFNNLYAAKIEVLNRGNKDLDEFTFGLTLSTGQTAVHSETHAPDRHHAMSVTTPVAWDRPSSEVDVTCKPFNRGDAYILDLFMVLPDGNVGPPSISFSSPAAVRFVEIPTTAEMLATIAESATIVLGPLRIFVDYSGAMPIRLKRRSD